MKTNAPYGSWSSPISAAMVAGKSPKMTDTQFAGQALFWSEAIAEENGRNAIMMHDGSQLQCILPAPLSAKSKVHEYGGAAYVIHNNHLIFVLADDQRIYTVDFTQDSCCPTPLSPENDALRFADLCIDDARNQVIAICEQHLNGEVINTIVALPLDGSGAMTTLHQGFDFYSNPRLCPDGNILSWLCWHNPDMPWDNSELWIADITAAGIVNGRKIVGNGNESLFQPQWNSDGDLFFVSDRNNWWNLYCLPAKEFTSEHPKPQHILDKAAEFATPQWVFGMSTYGFLNPRSILASYTCEGVWHLVEIEKVTDDSWENCLVHQIPCEASYIQNVCCNNNMGAFIGASPTQDLRIHRYQYRNTDTILSAPSSLGLDKDEFSHPESMTFNTSDKHVAHALFYPPTNPRYKNDDAHPPLIVICHGGPTGATEGRLNLKVQYWTSRGFAVADVNYRGSTGYGRDYRQQLFQHWGMYDVDDVCAVVDHLTARDLIDKNRCAIRGGSAGGYTVLAALAFRNIFSAGVSLYGVGDLEMLANDTHKFEARYLDKLIGPYPEAKTVYQQRSPIHAIDNIACPILILQGMQDKVVPPTQAQELYKKVKEKQLPAALITYEDEAHGFRNPDNIVHSLESELQFYGKIFDIELPAMDSPDIPLVNFGEN